MADSTSTTRKRHAFNGSCHCGNIRFIVFLNLPHDPPQSPQHVQSLYRCNCSACHKAGILHTRLDSTPDDFILLSPQDPFKDLGDYQYGEKILHYFFCRNCGIRCFTFSGEGENVDLDLRQLLGQERGQAIQEGDTTKVWRAKKEGWKDGRHTGYLSVNANTIDQLQEGFDLREWTEKGWIYYIEMFNPPDDAPEPMSYDRPFPGGVY